MAIDIKQSTSKGQSEEIELITLFKDDVLLFLEEDIKKLITDYFAIKRGFAQYGIVNLFDYSYLITPAFKALEGTLIQVAKSLKFDLSNYKFKIGVAFNDENLEVFYQDVLLKIEDLSEEDKSDIQMWLNDARRMLRHFRHSPAHFLGEKKENWEIAFSTGDHIVRIINEMCSSILSSEIIKKMSANGTT